MRTHYIKLISLLAITTLFVACNEEEAQSLQISVNADKTQVKVGEPVTFSIQHNAMAVSLYTGDPGHDYLTSAYYLLKEQSNENLQNNNFRPLDPDITPYNCDFSNTQAGATTIADNLAEVRNAGSGENLIGSEAEIVNDASLQKNVLRITSKNPDWWYQALRLNTNVKLGSNKKLNLRMKFDKNILEDIYSGEQHPEISTFPVVIRLGGIGIGETDITFSDNTVWDIYWNPSTTYANYSVDLAAIIDAWQGGTGKTMGILSYIQILFTSSGSIGYVGDYYVESATYGDIDYIPFSTGKAFNINDRTGALTYQYTYTQPGTYKVVVVGSNTNMNHDSNAQTSTINITVNP